MKVKSESEVAQLSLLATPWTAAYQAPATMGLNQAGVPEWIASAFSVFRFSFFLSFFCYRQDLAM